MDPFQCNAGERILVSQVLKHDDKPLAKSFHGFVSKIHHNFDSSQSERFETLLWVRAESGDIYRTLPQWCTPEPTGCSRCNSSGFIDLFTSREGCPTCNPNSLPKEVLDSIRLGPAWP